MPNIQSSINQLLGFVGGLAEGLQDDQAQGSVSKNIRIGNVRTRNNKYMKSSAQNNYKSVMKNIANKINDKSQQKKLHQEFMKFIRPGGNDGL